MQFPNGVNKSNLIKLGVLGAAYYLLKGRNQSPSKIENKSDNNTQYDDNQSSSATDNSKSTPFTLGKELAAKVLGKKF